MSVPRLRRVSVAVLCAGGIAACSRPGAVDAATRATVTAQVESTIRAASDLSRPRRSRADDESVSRDRSRGVRIRADAS